MRQDIGYLLVILLVAAAGGVIFWLRYNSHDRRYRREQRRDRERYRAMMDAKAEEHDEQP